ncbi:MAG: histone deacetylase family protein [Promethearchaeota archaeon]
MKIIFHPDFLQRIDGTPAGDKGRLDPSLQILKQKYEKEFITPDLASIEDILRAHSQGHVDSIQYESGRGQSSLFRLARLAAGGAIQCADLAMGGDASFGLIRPPGHHASRNSCWGFCYFNNMAISLLHIRAKYKKKKAYILDFDLHTGDGNLNILREYGKKGQKGQKDYEILNPDARSEDDYLEIVEEALDQARPCDIIVASAGFDQGLEDWGQLLSQQSYRKIGQMMKDFSIDRCGGRRFAILEGGYNFNAMAGNLAAFLDGFF